MQAALFGISMMQRSHRRALVVGTYVVLTVLMLAVFSVSLTYLNLLVFAWLVLLLNLVSYGLFGRVIKETTLTMRLRPMVMSLGLKESRDKDEPDEREIAVRNAAYFTAFRAVAIYALMLWLHSPALVSPEPTTTWLRLVLLLPLVAMTLTLPQAVILWTEPDLLEND